MPSGLLAAVAGKAPLVVTAHGRDVRNVGAIRGVGTATRATVRHAAAVIAVSDYLRRELEAKVPEARGKTEVIDSGVDLERFKVEPAPEDGPRFLCIGALTERKNVVRLAECVRAARRRNADLRRRRPATRPQLEGRERVELAGVVPHDEIPARIAAAHVVCQPSLIEPFGQAVLEAMACGRSVVATRMGGPPEFVPPEAGVLVDPLDEEALTDALRVTAGDAVPEPCRPRGRRAARCPLAGGAGRSDPRAGRSPTTLNVRSTSEPMPPPIRVLIADDHRLFAEALEAILDSEPEIEVVGRARNGEEAVAQTLELKPDVILMDIAMPVVDGVEATQADPQEAEARLRADADRLELAQRRRAGARGRRGRLRDEGPDRRAADRRDPGAGRLAAGTLGAPCFSSSRSSRFCSRRLSSALILMHSGRDAGLGGMGFTPASQGGTHIVERNLTRLTIFVAILFAANTILLFHLLK